MAKTTTPRMGVTQWGAGTDGVARTDFNNSLMNIEQRSAIYGHGVLSARPAAGVAGRFYFVTGDAEALNNGVLWYDNGATWAPTTVPANFITNQKLNDGAVTESKLGNGAVTLSKMAANSVDTAVLLDGAVTTAKIGNGAVTALSLAAAAVTSSKIADRAVLTQNIEDGAVTNVKIGNTAVNTAKLADLAVTTAKLANDAVTRDKLAANVISTTEIADLSVTEAKLAAASVTNTKLGNGAVTHAKVAAANVDGAAATPSMRTLGNGGAQAMPGNSLGTAAPKAEGATAVIGVSTRLAREDHVHPNTDEFIRCSVVYSNVNAVDDGGAINPNGTGAKTHGSAAASGGGLTVPSITAPATGMYYVSATLNLMYSGASPTAGQMFLEISGETESLVTFGSVSGLYRYGSATANALLWRNAGQSIMGLLRLAVGTSGFNFPSGNIGNYSLYVRRVA